MPQKKSKQTTGPKSVYSHKLYTKTMCSIVKCQLHMRDIQAMYNIVNSMSTFYTKLTQKRKCIKNVPIIIQIKILIIYFKRV